MPLEWKEIAVVLHISRLMNAASPWLTQKDGDSVYKWSLSSHLAELHTKVIYNKGEKVYC